MRGIFCAWALVVGLSACSTQNAKVDFSDRERGLRGGEYASVFDRWTRHERIAQGADTILEVWGTLKGWEFREAYVERYADLYNVSAPDRAAMKKNQHEADHDSVEFVVVAQCWNYKWNDFNKHNSAWKISLVDAAGHELVPDTVHLERLPDLFEREFFPTKTPFSKTYLVKFKRPKDEALFLGEASGSLSLRFSSPQGQAELVWLAEGKP